jgi:M6 family metalloprotease-like protein
MLPTLNRFVRAGAGALATVALAGGTAGTAHAAEKVTPDVSGLQRVLVVGCRFSDTTSPDILDYSNDGIRQILSHTHDYFDVQSNHRVDFEGEFTGWHTLPKSVNDYGDDGKDATKDCQDISSQVLADRGEQATDYRAIVMLFNYDKGISNETNTGDGRPGTWVRLRYTGGVGGGWTSEAVWAHEMGHAFGLQHSTFPTRQDGNQYNDFQDAMSGYSHSAQKRWNFPVGGVCNGIAGHPRCIYSGEADEVPVDYSAFQKQRLGWLFPDQIATHWGGRSTYQLSAPTYNPSDGLTVEKLKMVEVKIPGSTAYYAIEYRRGDDGGDSNASAFRRDWDSYDLGIRSDRVTVYLVEPDLYPTKAAAVLGDANLAAVLNPGDGYTAPGGSPPITVTFDSVEPGPRMNASVTVTTPHPPAPQTFLSADGKDGSWVNHDVSANLLAYQAVDGAPLAQTYYGVDDGGCSDQTLDCAFYSPDGFTVAGEGVHDVTYFSTDVTGGAETAQHTTIRIDKTAPATTAAVATVGAGRELTLAAGDALSGVRETDYDLDGAGFKPYGAPLDITAPGAHTVRFRSVDNAGNFETPQQVQVNVPLPPLTATATATPAKIAKADGRAVKVHIAIRSNASGATLRLTKVTHTGKGKTRGWTVGTADVDGQVFAVKGVTYTLTYAVKDGSGRTVQATAKVIVAP